MKMPAHCAHYKYTKSHCPTLLSSCRSSGYASTFSISHNRLLQKTSFNFSMKLKEDLSLRVKQDLLLAVHFVRNCELLTTLCTTSGQHAATVCSQHTLTETMLIVSLSVVGLECPFHCLYILFLLFVYRSAKQELPATLGNMRLQNYI